MTNSIGRGDEEKNSSIQTTEADDELRALRKVADAARLALLCGQVVGGSKSRLIDALALAESYEPERETETSAKRLIAP